MSKLITPPDLGFPFSDLGTPAPRHPISFVVIRFSDEYFTNFALSEAANSPGNEVIIVDNTGNLFFPNLTRAMQHGIDQAQHDLVVVVHEDVLLPNGWQALFEYSLNNLENNDANWKLLCSVGWSEQGNIVGHWKDPRNFLDSFSTNRGGYESVASCDEQILVFHKKRLQKLDLDLPGIHHIGRDLPMMMGSKGGVYVIDAPTIHKYADARGNRIQTAVESEKIQDRSSLTYLADRSVCNDYIKKKWPSLEVKDYKSVDFTLPFDEKDKLQQLDSPIILIGRGGGGTRLLGSVAEDAGIFLGNTLNDSMDSVEMVLPVYQGIIEKYRTFTEWQKEQIVPRLRWAAANMIKGMAADRLWGFKLPESILLLPEILQAFPKAKFIYLVRDPLATCMRRTHMTARMDNHIGRITLPIAYDWVGRARLHILQDEPEIRMAYTTLHQMYIAKDFLESLSADDRRTIRFEQLLRKPDKVIKDVCKWLEVEKFAHKTVDAVDISRSNLDKRNYSPTLAVNLSLILEQLQVDLGYVNSANSMIDEESEKDINITGEGILETKLIVVLGMHRSGTSALSNLLHSNGVDFGSNLLDAQEDNPEGFFEDKDVYQLNEELLNALGYEWFSSALIDPREQKLSMLTPFLDRAKKLLREKISTHAVYGLKDPRFCKLLPFWKQVFSSLGVDPVYIIIVRNPHDVALSLSHRHDFDTEKSVRIWLSHYLSIIDDTEILLDSIVVDYDDLLDHVDVSAARLVEVLHKGGITLNSGAMTTDILDRTLRHGNNISSPLSSTSHVRVLCNTVYELLHEIITNTLSTQDLLLRLGALNKEAQDVKTLFNVDERAERLAAYHGSSKHIDNMGVEITNLKSQFGQAQHELRQVHHELAGMTRANEQSLAELEEVAHLYEKEQTNLHEHQKASHQYEIDVKNSISWRVTAPLRMAGDGYTTIFRRSAGVKEVVRRIGLYKTLHYAGKVLVREGITGVRNRAKSLDMNSAHNKTYQEWVEEFDTVSDSSRKRFIQAIRRLGYQPVISIVMPVYDPPVDLLIKAIDSILNQVYQNWELCIADDKSPNSGVRDTIEKYADKDERIKYIFREENGHISLASNTALELVNGDFVALMDHDDLLPPHSLFWVAQAINDNPRGKLFYSDEDKIDLQDVRHDPYFKCDWNPDLFYSHNMFSHLGVYDAALLRDIGGFREGFEGSQDYDLALRCSEKIDLSQIIHIPRILYHWRVMPGSTALDASEKPYAMIAGERAINDHFLRTGVDAECKLLGCGYRVKYEIKGNPLVSVIIPTRDEVDVLRTCLNSIYEKTTYENYEIIVVDNGSERAETLEYLLEIQRDHDVKVIRDDSEFNFSRLNNKGVEVASGEIVALVNNDVEVITPNWMTEMVSHANRQEVGAVGCRLIYPDNTLQHAGIILGLGGLAAYSHRCIPKDSPGYFGRAMLLQSMSAVTAACLFVRKSVYTEVNGLDADNLAVAYNDVDFCLRLREAGYRNIFTPYAELTHFESKTRGPEDTPEKQERSKKEYAYMRKRWGELLDRDPAYNPNLTLDREDFSLAEVPRVGHVL